MSVAGIVCAAMMVSAVCGAQSETIQQRQQFLAQELITARPSTWIFRPGEIPRIVWRDLEEVRRLGFEGPVRVRWFDARFTECPTPDKPGRWHAWIEGTAPNGTPFRRAMTFYGLPKDFLSGFAPDFTVAFPNFPGSNAPAVWREHQAEIVRLISDGALRGIFDSEQGAILLAGMAEAQPLGRPARFVESVLVRNAESHLALKLKLQGLQDRVRPLQPPRRRDPPAPVLREGSPQEAGVKPDAKAAIDAVCRDWAKDTGEPFVTLVARNGVIVTHEAFGQGKDGKPIPRDYRCWVASITKTVTALLFARFLDQGVVALDKPVSVVFPDYPKNDPHVPTFRQCLTHTSGLSGHGDAGGAHNPHFENVILNAIDMNEPGARYAYSGLGFELVAKAMEILSGKSIFRLFHEDLFQPLGFQDVPIGNASSDGEFTAWELGVLAQLLANRGSYGAQELFGPHTFEKLLPAPVRVADRGYAEDEGLGLNWRRPLKDGAPRGSKRPEDLLFSSRTVGHGSFSGSIFMVDLDQQLLITQVRKQSGPRSAEWNARFYKTVAAALERASQSASR